MTAEKEKKISSVNLFTADAVNSTYSKRYSGNSESIIHKKKLKALTTKKTTRQAVCIFSFYLFLSFSVKRLNSLQ